MPLCFCLCTKVLKQILDFQVFEAVHFYHAHFLTWIWRLFLPDSDSSLSLVPHWCVVFVVPWNLSCEWAASPRFTAHLTQYGSCALPQLRDRVTWTVQISDKHFVPHKLNYVIRLQNQFTKKNTTRVDQICPSTCRHPNLRTHTQMLVRISWPPREASMALECPRCDANI